MMVGLLVAVLALATLSPSAYARLWKDDVPHLRLDNGLGKTPPMGWNSWNHYRCEINEAMIRDTADALNSSGLAAAGYVYLNIDDCWSARIRDEKLNLVPDPVNFPGGIKPLADYAHSKGLKLGIYSDAGYLTCQRRPGSLGHEKQDAALFAEWGVDYLKYDNCYNDRSKPELRYPIMRDALLATERPIFFSMCEWGEDAPATWAAKVGNSWRTTEDIRDNWASMTSLADQNNKWARYAAPGGWNDPDMLEVGNGGMTDAEYRSHFSIWCIMKAPLLVGTDITQMSEATKKILLNTELIAVNQDPLGVQGSKRVRHPLGEEVWVGPLSKGRAVVALWNRSGRKSTITASWAEVGLAAGTVMKARDLWKHEAVPGTLTGSISAEVDQHDTAVFVLEPVVDLVIAALRNPIQAQ